MCVEGDGSLCVYCMCVEGEWLCVCVLYVCGGGMALCVYCMYVGGMVLCVCTVCM